MNTIKLRINPPTTPNDNSFSHASTSWKVSKNPDMADGPDILLAAYDDTVNKLTYDFQYDIAHDEVLYCSVKVKFTNGEESNWSRPITIDSTMSGYKISSTLIITPEVSLDAKIYGEADKYVDVKISNMFMYMGTDTWESTSWRITDTSGNVKWERAKDKDNKVGIRIPLNNFVHNKSYIVMAKHEGSTGTSSNYGKSIFTLSPKILPNFTIDTSEFIYTNALNFVKITHNRKDNVENMYKLRNENGWVVLSAKSEDNFSFSGELLEYGKVYSLEVYVTYKDGLQVMDSVSLTSKKFTYTDCKEKTYTMKNIVITGSNLDNSIFDRRIVSKEYANEILPLILQNGLHKYKYENGIINHVTQIAGYSYDQASINGTHVLLPYGNDMLIEKYEQSTLLYINIYNYDISKNEVILLNTASVPIAYPMSANMVIYDDRIYTPAMDGYGDMKMVSFNILTGEKLLNDLPPAPSGTKVFLSNKCDGKILVTYSNLKVYLYDIYESTSVILSDVNSDIVDVIDLIIKSSNGDMFLLGRSGENDVYSISKYSDESASWESYDYINESYIEGTGCIALDSGEIVILLNRTTYKKVYILK